MKKFVRESKFRHVFGKIESKEKQFEGIIVSKSRVDGNTMAVNELFIAVVLDSFSSLCPTVVRRDQPGRFDHIYKLISHTSPVIDLSFDPFNCTRLCSGSDDGSFIIWELPEHGLECDIEKPLGVIQNSERRGLQSLWHPAASDVILLANHDVITFYNLQDYSVILTITPGEECDQICSVSLNSDGTKVVAAFKDKLVRIYSTLDGSLVNSFQPYNTTKPIRAIFGDGEQEYIIVSGFSKMSDRCIGVWSIANLSEPVSMMDVDSGVSALNIYYDPDISLLAAYSKGSNMLNIYEIDEAGKMYLVSIIQQGEQQSAACFANKLGCDTSRNEIMHFVKAVQKGLEVVHIIVPRKSERFQEDIFPLTNSNEPAMTAKDFAAGKRVPPLKISPKDVVHKISSVPFKPQQQQLKSSTSSISKANPTVARSTTASSSSTMAQMEARLSALEAKVDELLKK